VQTDCRQCWHKVPKSAASSFTVLQNGALDGTMAKQHNGHGQPARVLPAARSGLCWGWGPLRRLFRGRQNTTDWKIRPSRLHMCRSHGVKLWFWVPQEEGILGPTPSPARFRSRTMERGSTTRSCERTGKYTGPTCCSLSHTTRGSLVGPCACAKWVRPSGSVWPWPRRPLCMQRMWKTALDGWEINIPNA
jgi:hypothetical protein